LPGDTKSGFACFPGDLSSDDFSDGNNNLFISGMAALFSQNSRYLNAALAAQNVGGNIADIGKAVAGAGFNSEPIDYGGLVAGVDKAISVRIDCPY